MNINTYNTREWDFVRRERGDRSEKDRSIEDRVDVRNRVYGGRKEDE